MYVAVVASNIGIATFST